jgi:DNA-binding MarR family transcriptional regulator
MAAPRSSPSLQASADEQLVLQTISHTARAFKIALHPELEREHLTTPMWWALHELALDGAMSVGAIASACAVTPANISSAVDELVGAGLADRAGSPKDRRITLITATSKGRTLYRRIWTRTIAQFGAPLRGLPKADLETTARVLGRLTGPVGTVEGGSL